MTHAGHEMMVSRGRGILARPDDGDAFEHGYLTHCQSLVHVRILFDIPLRTHFEGQRIALDPRQFDAKH